MWGKAGPSPPAGHTRRWQHNQAVSGHAQQRHPARHVLELTVGLAPVPQLTQQARQRRTVHVRISLNQGGDGLNILSAHGPGAVHLHELSTSAIWGVA